jgi:hypothetical protein
VSHRVPEKRAVEASRLPPYLVQTQRDAGWPARADLADAPGIERALKMPDFCLGPSKLVAEAGAMRRAAELYEEQFINGSRAGDFLEQLDAAIEAVRSSMQAKERDLRRHVGATGGLEQDPTRSAGGRGAGHHRQGRVPRQRGDPGEVAGREARAEGAGRPALTGRVRRTGGTR